MATYQNYFNKINIFSIFLIIFCLINVSCVNGEDCYPNPKKSNKEDFVRLFYDLQEFIKSEKALSILKLEYEIKSLPEFIVIRKLQTSILQTYYIAYDIAYIADCYSYLDYNNIDKMNGYFNLFMSTATLFNDSSEKTIEIIDTNLSIKDGYLQREYSDFANLLTELSNDIVLLHDLINRFILLNISEEYIIDYKNNLPSIAQKRKNDIDLAHSDYAPPKSLIQYIIDSFKKLQVRK